MGLSLTPHSKFVTKNILYLFVVSFSNFYSSESKISRWIANPEKGCANLLYGKIFAENCMKRKALEPTVGARVPSTNLDPPVY